jgi:formate dehydrogenase maturation protein FdhE
MPRFRVGDRVRLNLQGARYASCPQCGAQWIVLGCAPQCPECDSEGLLGDHVRDEDLKIERPRKC